jgi:DNA-binding CsgD family transcriptional regulator
MHQAGMKERPTPCCCHTEHFTEREVEVLCHVAAGSTNDEVATALGISAHTVAGHLREMLARSNARSRAELVAWAYAVGVLAPHVWPPRWSGRRCLQLSVRAQEGCAAPRRHAGKAGAA